MSPDDRTCTHHAELPAIAVCTSCGQDICSRCHGIDIRGMALCRPCQREMAPPAVPWEADDEETTSLHRFLETAWAALAGPRSFFRRFRRSPSWLPAASFGILCIGIGMLVNTLWQKAFSADYDETLATYHAEVGVSPEIIELLMIGAIPFGAVFLYFIHTALFYLAARTFQVDGANWHRIATITGYSLAAYLLLVFPPIGEFSLGHFLMIFWLFNLEVSAVRSLFGLGFWRAIGVVLLPMIVFVLVIG